MSVYQNGRGRFQKMWFSKWEVSRWRCHCCNSISKHWWQDETASTRGTKLRVQQSNLTATGFSFSHSCSIVAVLFSTSVSSEEIFICRLATWVWMEESLRFMMSVKAPHSPSTLSMYSQLDGNWKRWRSRMRWASLYIYRGHNQDPTGIITSLLFFIFKYLLIQICRKIFYSIIIIKIIKAKWPICHHVSLLYSSSLPLLSVINFGGGGGGGGNLFDKGLSALCSSSCPMAAFTSAQAI